MQRTEPARERMSRWTKWTCKCRNTPQRGPHRPENVALRP